MSVLMVDGTTTDVPFILQRFGPQTPVAGYVTGPGIEWTEGQFVLFARKIRIAQSWVPAIDQATDARCLDVETGAARAQDWPGFYESRTNKAESTCYCSLETVPQVVAACEAVPDMPLPPRWWLAWYWGRPGYPTTVQTLAELKRLTGVTLELGSVWAVQYASFPQWDESRVYGVPDFSRR